MLIVKNRSTADSRENARTRAAMAAVSSPFLWAARSRAESTTRSGVRLLLRKRDGIHDFCPAFSRVRRKFTIPDRFGKRRRAIGKAGRKFEKSSRILKSRTETGIPAGYSQSRDRILDFRPVFSKVVRNLKTSDDF